SLVAKVNGPLAETARLSPPLSWSTRPVPDSPVTEPPTAYCVAGGGLFDCDGPGVDPPPPPQAARERARILIAPIPAPEWIRDLPATLTRHRSIPSEEPSAARAAAPSPQPRIFMTRGLTTV